MGHVLANQRRCPTGPLGAILATGVGTVNRPRPRNKSSIGRRKLPAANPALVRSRLNALFDQLEAQLLSGQSEAMSDVLAEVWRLRTQAPAVLAERLAGQRAAVPDFAFDLLRGFAGSSSPSVLRRIYDDPRAPDLTRWAARRRAPWPEHGEARARLAFLAELRAPDEALLRALAVASASKPPDGEVLHELLAYLGVLPPERAQRILVTAIAEPPPRLEWLLRGALHLPKPPIQQLLIDELVRRRDLASADALARLAVSAASPEIRQAAATAGRRLMISEVGRSVASADAAEWPLLEHIFASPIDGDGGQTLLLTRTWPVGGQTLVVHVFHKDGWGLKDVIGISRESAEDVQDTLMTFLSQGIPLVEIDLATARGILAHAVARNAATGHALPPAFEVWAPFFHDHFPPLPDEQIVPAELPHSQLARHTPLPKKSAQLLAHPFFDAWFFNPDEIAPQLESRPDWLSGLSSPRGYASILAALLDDQQQELLVSRLQRQARLLEYVGDQQARKMALAVAASLARKDVSPDQQPFLREMVDRSVRNLLLGDPSLSVSTQPY